jgi:hypothetical protein
LNACEAHVGQPGFSECAKGLITIILVLRELKPVELIAEMPTRETTIQVGLDVAVGERLLFMLYRAQYWDETDAWKGTTNLCGPP